MKKFHNDIQQIELSKRKSEIFNAISHLIATLISLISLILLIIFSALQEKPVHVLSFGVYGISVFLSMFCSSMLHFSRWLNKFRIIYRILDHNAIYLLIAGTYTPFCAIVVRGTLGWIILGIIWGLAISNVVLKSIFINKMPRKISVIIYLVMGWLAVLLIISIYNLLGAGAIILMVIGGCFYSLGAIVYLKKKPNPVPNIFTFHGIWHLMVMMGNISFMLIMFLYVLSYEIK